jgi:endogenous inhibitor of DNA gyrase (YacG/DUF329 family)
MCNSYWLIHGKEGLWKNNKRCPNCGKMIKSNKHQSVETGYRYCSEECAKIHTNKTYKESF